MCKPTHPPRRSAMPGQFLGQVTLRVCLLNVCQVGTPLGPPERHKMNSRPFREFLRGFASLLAREEAGPRLVSSGPFRHSHVRGSFPRFPHFFLLGRRGVCACAHPRPPAHPCGLCHEMHAWRCPLTGRTLHARRALCLRRMRVIPASGAGHSRLSVPRRSPFVEGLCPSTRPGVLRVVLRPRAARRN